MAERERWEEIRAQLTAAITENTDSPWVSDRVVEAACKRIAELEERIAKMRHDVDWVFSAESWMCPECGSVDTDEFYYTDDFGSRKCNACSYTGDPGEDFPLANVLLKRIAEQEERIAELEDKNSELLNRLMAAEEGELGKGDRIKELEALLASKEDYIDALEESS